jgi:hypothetical protein
VARISIPSIAGRFVVTLLATTCFAEPSVQPDLHAVHPILSSVLDATSAGATERRAVEARFDALARDLAARVGAVRSPQRRARRLHLFLHDRVFLRYEDDADGVEDVLARGNFNCVSATLVEGMLASAIGLKPTIVAGPRHIRLRMTLPARVVDIETTARDGFDVRGSTEASARFLLADGLAEPEAYADRGGRELADHDEHSRLAVTLADGAAFVWHNAAERALARGDGRAAALSLLAGETLYPGVAAGRDSLQTELGRAFRQDYDAGRFDDAYRTAAIGVSLGPTVVSAHDRLIAAAVQRVEGLLDHGDVGQAEDILVDLRRMLENGASRFERHMLPLIVAAAVRIGDWERAECLSDRFGAVELDAVEARRLRSWVRGRRIEDPSAP